MVESVPTMVSIQCFTYNHEPYIRQCLDGFVMQKTNFRFEAIVHDDASTDSTAVIIREYAEKYPDIIRPIYQTENQYSKQDGTLQRIMNEACTGKYIAMCEGDDYWTDPLKLQKQVDFLESHPNYTLCFHNALVIYDRGDKQSHLFNDFKEMRSFGVSDIVGKWYIPTASIMLCAKKLNHPEWFYKIYSGDQTTALLAASNGYLCFLPDVMSVYRINYGASITAMLAREKLSDFTTKEHIKLYNYFNKETEGLFNYVIAPHLHFLEKEVILINNRKKIGLLAFFMQPVFCLKLLVKKLSKW